MNLERKGLHERVVQAGAGRAREWIGDYTKI
jgi:hypothetical protein